MERTPGRIRTDLVARDETRVMFVRAIDEPQAIQQAWQRLETGIGAPRGRKFFGSFDVDTSRYRACVQIRDGDDPKALGFESATLPGGTYLRARLRGEPPRVYEQIGPTFMALTRQAITDHSRPSIEVYRRRDEIDLLLPVLG